MVFVNIEVYESYPVYCAHQTHPRNYGVDVSQGEYNWIEWIFEEYAKTQIRLSELLDIQMEDANYQARNYDR